MRNYLTQIKFSVTLSLLIALSINALSQCSIGDFVLFEHGQSSLDILTELSSNKDYIIIINSVYEPSANVKDPNGSKNLRTIGFSIKNPICINKVQNEQKCYLRLLGDKLYSRNFTITFKPNDGKLAKQFFEMLEKQVIDSLSSEQIHNSNFYKLTDKDTKEVTGNGSDFVIDKDCENYTTLKMSYYLKYKTYIDKNYKIHNTGVIDYFEIKIIITNLEGINFNCNSYEE